VAEHNLSVSSGTTAATFTLSTGDPTMAIGMVFSPPAAAGGPTIYEFAVG